ncbi:hypothetical protein FAI40_01785 [Acetobacteraceae bacterium]|nr:hypothetical protein FAI40_01785 [Acetobacteraceae bacterium]
MKNMKEEVKEIEVGAAEGDLRLWRVKEAQRQGELRYECVRKAFEAYRNRALNLVGWNVALMTALAAILKGSSMSFLAYFCVFLFIISIVGGLAILLPAKINLSGDEIDYVMDEDNYETELEIREALAIRLKCNEEKAEKILWRLEKLMRISYATFSLAAVISAFYILGN